MLRARGLGGALLVLLAAPAQATFGTPFEGTFSPHGPVAAVASFRSGAEGADFLELFQSRNVPAGAEAVFTSSIARLTIYEWRVRDDGLQPGDRYKETIRVLHSPRVFVDSHDESLGRERHWLAVFDADQMGTTAAVAGLDCRLVPEPADSIVFEGLELENRTGAAMPWMVRAQCAAATPERVGAATVAVFATRIRVHHIDRDNGSRPAEFTVETGYRVEGRTVKECVVCTVTRTIAVFETHANDTRLSWSEPVNVTLRAPVVAVSGSLTVPPFEGTIRWGSKQLVDSREPIVSEGNFAVRSEPSKLSIQGWSLTGPPGMAAIVAGRSDGHVAAALALSTALAGALLWRYRWIAWGLFTRLSQPAALDHPRRRAILEVVRANPGLQVNELQERLGATRKNIDYHVGVLRRQGLLDCHRFGRHISLFERGAIPWSEQLRVWLQRQPAVRTVLADVASRPNSTQAEIARRLTFSQGYLSVLLRQLEANGLVRTETRNGRRSYVPTMDAADLAH